MAKAKQITGSKYSILKSWAYIGGAVLTACFPQEAALCMIGCFLIAAIVINQ